ncbi:MAG: FkbM family methyltransferase [Oscillatoria sp. PMC 1050.18]|nr:FkbM family methyltransferase [Oscillatoria sp. PMC 1050.18]
MIFQRLKHASKLFLQPAYRKSYLERQRLKKMPRYMATSTEVLGKEIELVDPASFLFMYKEIFQQEIYKFKAQKTNPTIIDCGANIGLSILYFKQLYPESKIIAFEPDRKVFKILEKNVKQFSFSDIELVEKAIWSSETTLEFMSEGADGGRIVQLESEREKYQVSTIRLREYLTQPVEFVKLDIEGAETEVVQDCQDLLRNIDNLFVEYHSFVNERQSVDIILKILSEAGFRIHIHPSVISPQPFYHRDICLGMDLQLNIFAFREKHEIS